MVTGPAVSLAKVRKRFGRAVALDGVDLEVGRGEVFGLIGPNGAGKTTTMRLLLDVLRPTAGAVRVLGEDPRRGGARLRARVGYLPGELRLDSRSKVRELLAFYGRLSGGVAAVRVRELAERLDLDLDRRLGSLSKGNKQKVGLAQALMHGPELLVLDEPTSGLDPLVQQTFLDLVREARAAGQTVLLSSHVLSEVQHVAGRVAIMREGRVARLASVEELRAGAPRLVRVTVPAEQGEAVRAAFSRLPGMVGLVVDRVGNARGPADGAAPARLSGRFTGAPSALLEALRQWSVEDLVVAEPDLEEAVLALYEPGREDHRMGA